ncbi:MAG: hypothetical protein DCF17_03240 [Shackletoniella antarctica]|uniref:Uncharacterized protein n=1 Tax=Shackletoniella antarctica TaxID=268115 RepID=A0A2W4YD98_9CYAN|nr:MAG: hypothetical protein DCF17_03240 [Shackletoniella antarctica]
MRLGTLGNMAIHPNSTMALQLYLFACLMVFLFAIGPFLSDPSRPKNHLSSWAFLLLAMALSPVTLPNMLRKWMLKRWMSHQDPSTSINMLLSRF